jgi:hypothetical protein
MQGFIFVLGMVFLNANAGVAFVSKSLVLNEVISILRVLILVFFLKIVMFFRLVVILLSLPDPLRV